MRIVKPVKRFLRSLGVEVTRFHPETSNSALLQTILNFYNIDLVLDVGANVGQYGMTLREAGYKRNIISFEPMQLAFQQLSECAARYKDWTVVHSGVGAVDCEMVINVARNSASSSILSVTKNSLDAEPQTATERQERIKIVSLDSYLQGKLTGFKNIYLKVDVQGYELEVLKGAKNLIKDFTIVQLEMSFVSLYENGPLWKEIVSAMDSIGYEVFSILPDFRDLRTGRMLQADGIFINKSKVS